jgi:hypothetical protein
MDKDDLWIVEQFSEVVAWHLNLHYTTGCVWVPP